MHDRKCPVCGAGACRVFVDLIGPRYCPQSRYHRCGRCEATFLDSAFHPTREAELAHYLEHENTFDDPRYRAFLARLTTPLIARLESGRTGLDFGCGPVPVLADIMNGAGFETSSYDVHFAPDPALLARQYDFITCSETVEHFHRPSREFALFDRLLRPGGWLAIMTCFQCDDAKFADWHYRRDPTHVVFYREHTFRTLARQWGWSCEIPAKNIALLRKSGPAGT